MSLTARGWLAASAPIALWMVHLTASAAIVEPVCRRGIDWLGPVLTIVLVAACVPFLLLAAGVARAAMTTCASSAPWPSGWGRSAWC